MCSARSIMAQASPHIQRLGSAAVMKQASTPGDCRSAGSQLKYVGHPKVPVGRYAGPLERRFGLKVHRDGRDQFLECVGAEMLLPIDEERGRAVDAAAHATEEV